MRNYMVHYVESYGEVKFYRHPQAKSVAIHIAPLEGALVRVPTYYPVSLAYKFFCDTLPSLTHMISVAKRKEAIFYASRQHLLPINFDASSAQLKARLHTLAGEYGYSFNKVYVKRHTARWGSCTHNNNINLNAQLVSLPNALSDYVLLHELVHTEVKNHQQEFWAEFTRILPTAKILDRTLRRDYFIIPNHIAYELAD